MIITEANDGCNAVTISLFETEYLFLTSALCLLLEDKERAFLKVTQDHPEMNFRRADFGLESIEQMIVEIGAFEDQV